MNGYIVFIKDDESKVMINELVTRDITKELKREGFTKYPHVIKANDEKDAIEKLNKKGNEHLNTLGEYSGNVFFYCAILVVGLLLAFIFA